MSEPLSSLEVETLDPSIVKNRSIVGAIAFTSRNILMQFIGLVAVFLLTIFLSPAEYGIFFVVEATVGFFIYFSDIGLAAALIQKKSALTRLDLTTTFTVQTLLVSAIVLIAYFLTPLLIQNNQFGPQAQILFYALLFSFFISSLKTIPSILMERDLEFNKLVIPQIIENLVFYTTAVVFAYQGLGIQSYTLAVLARAVVGFVVLYYLKPWLPGFSLDLSTVKHLTRFGAPFQLNSILALFKDKALIIFLSKVLSPTEIGYLGWAEKWALTPIRFFADPVLKVTFPAYSRLQNHKDELKKAIEKSLFYVSFLVFPSVFGLIAVAPLILNSVPSYTKWQPALIALTLYSINTIFSSISITLTNTLNATGRVSLTLKLMVMWTLLTWILTPLSLRFFGYNGVALASALTATSSLVGFYLVRKIVAISIFLHLLPPLIHSLIMFICLKAVSGLFIPGTLPIVLYITTGLIIYFGSFSLFSFSLLKSEYLIIKKHFLTRL